jgi:hypothetical protein
MGDRSTRIWHPQATRAATQAVTKSMSAGCRSRRRSLGCRHYAAEHVERQPPDSRGSRTNTHACGSGGKARPRPTPSCMTPGCDKKCRRHARISAMRLRVEADSSHLAHNTRASQACAAAAPGRTYRTASRSEQYARPPMSAALSESGRRPGAGRHHLNANIHLAAHGPDSRNAETLLTHQRRPQLEVNRSATKAHPDDSITNTTNAVQIVRLVRLEYRPPEEKCKPHNKDRRSARNAPLNAPLNPQRTIEQRSGHVGANPH